MASNRPWQGTFLATLYFIGAVSSVFFGIAVLFFGNVISGMITGAMKSGGSEMMTDIANQAGYNPSDIATGTIAGGLGEMIANLGMVIGIVILAWALLDFFIGRGYLKGQRWAVVLSTILIAIGTLASLVATFSGGSEEILNNLVGLAISGFMLYLAIVCWQNKFYASK